MSDQLPLPDGSPMDGLAVWRARREERLRELGRALGLPLGHACRVELAGGVILEGRLVLDDEGLILPEAHRNPKLPLRIGRCVFTPAEIVAAVRSD